MAVSCLMLKPHASTRNNIVYHKLLSGDIFIIVIKVVNAENAGAIGVIIYSDPIDYARDGDESVYPNDWWLPETGVQRGNVYVSDAKGDPLTPGYPSKRELKRAGPTCNSTLRFEIKHQNPTLLLNV